jgi:hypothetical protein
LRRQANLISVNDKVQLRDLLARRVLCCWISPDESANYVTQYSCGNLTARFSNFCHFGRNINGVLPYVLQSCSLPAALSTDFCYHLPTADWLRNRHLTPIHLPKSHNLFISSPNNTSGNNNNNNNNNNAILTRKCSFTSLLQLTDLSITSTALLT